MSRRLMSVAVLVTVATLIAGCGSSGATSGTTSGSGTTTSAGSPASSAAPPSSTTQSLASQAAAGPSDSTAASAGGSTAASTAVADPKLLLPADVKPGSVLTLANDPTDPPFDSIAGGQFQGVDYDIAQALAGVLGLKIQFKQISFDGIIPALQTGRFDMSMSAISDLKERLDKVDFVDYFVSGYAIVVRAGNPDKITSLDDFCGRTSGAQQGNEQVLILQEQSKKCVAAGKKPITVKIYPVYSQMKLELQQGRLSAILQGIAGAAYVSKTTDGVLDMVKTDQVISPSPYGIAFPKGSKLVKPFQAAMQEIIDNGTYVKILDKWQLTMGTIKTATINAATH